MRQMCIVHRPALPDLPVTIGVQAVAAKWKNVSESQFRCEAINISGIFDLKS
jgi:hypothetical protein